MLFHRAPQRDEAFALKRFDDEIAPRLQPCPGKFERQFAKVHRPRLIGSLHAG